MAKQKEKKNSKSQGNEGSKDKRPTRTRLVQPLKNGLGGEIKIQAGALTFSKDQQLGRKSSKGGK